VNDRAPSVLETSLKPKRWENDTEVRPSRPRRVVTMITPLLALEP